EINRFVLYLVAPPPPTTRWTPVLAIPGRDTKFRKNDSANGNNFILNFSISYHRYIFCGYHSLTQIPYIKERFLTILRSCEKGANRGPDGGRARGPKSGVFARGHMALSAEINRFVLYLEAPPPPTTRWTPVLAIPGRD